jgi:hypothetical protein
MLTNQPCWGGQRGRMGGGSAIASCMAGITHPTALTAACSKRHH